jgi:hypothetical protein
VPELQAGVPVYADRIAEAQHERLLGLPHGVGRVHGKDDGDHEDDDGGDGSLHWPAPTLIDGLAPPLAPLPA